MWRFVDGVDKPAPKPRECIACKKDCKNAGASSVHKTFSNQYKSWKKQQEHTSTDNKLPKSDIRNFVNETDAVHPHKSIPNTHNDGKRQCNQITNGTTNIEPLTKKSRQNSKQLRKRYPRTHTANVATEYIELLRDAEVKLDDDEDIHVLNKIKVTHVQQGVATKYGITRCLVSQWYADRKNIFKDLTALGFKKSKSVHRTGGERGAKYPKQESELRSYLPRKDQGRKITAIWFRLQFKRLLRRDKPHEWDEFKYLEGWF